MLSEAPLIQEEMVNDLLLTDLWQIRHTQVYGLRWDALEKAGERAYQATLNHLPAVLVNWRRPD